MRGYPRGLSWLERRRWRKGLLDRELLDKAFGPPPRVSPETWLSVFIVGSGVAALFVGMFDNALEGNPKHLVWMIPFWLAMVAGTWKGSRAIDRQRGW